MQNPNNISKEVVLNLLAATVDGIDGIEAEQGPEALAQFWNVEKVERARLLLDQLGIDPVTAATSG